jgi:hypothetical protein
VHGFRWFTVCAPAGWDPATEEWEVCPCGWRPELGKHYAKAGHVQWWREQIKERGSLEAVYREVRRRQREYGDAEAPAMIGLLWLTKRASTRHGWRTGGPGLATTG